MGLMIWRLIKDAEKFIRKLKKEKKIWTTNLKINGSKRKALKNKENFFLNKEKDWLWINIPCLTTS
jgi:hypothetical protein